MGESLRRFWYGVTFVARAYRNVIIAVALVVLAGVAVLAFMGFSFQIGRFFAAGTPTPTPRVNPHVYCDFATRTCLTKNTEDWNAPQCGTASGGATPTPSSGGGGGGGGGNDIYVPSANILNSVANAETLCSPGQCRTWSGADVNSWTPASSPTGLPACEPLSRIDSTIFPGITTNLPQPVASFPDCLVIEDRSSEDPNWGTTTENTVPQVLRDKPNARLFYKAVVINNCPWTVHLVFLTAGSKKASFDVGVVGPNRNIALPESEFTKAFVEDTAPARDFPSCWNSTGGRSATCGKEISIEYKLNTYTCGSLGVQIAWWHMAAGGGHVNDTRGLVSALNYGRDCSGSSAERAPGSLSSAGTGTGATACSGVPAGATLSPAVMGGQCGTTQNMVTWTNPRTPTQTRNTLFRNGYDSSGKLLSTTAVFSETGCWTGSGSGTFTDKNIPPLPSGSVYWYVMKTNGSPNVWSANALKCPAPGSGAPVPSTSPTPVVTSSPVVTATFSAAPSLTPTPPVGIVCPDGTSSTSDVDCDGVSNTVECPGYRTGMNTASCPDTNGDGLADIAEPSVQNYGAGGTVTQSPSVGGPGVGGVQTGPGDAVFLALVVSAAVALAYVSYTRSDLGQRHEIEEIRKNEPPLDFRS